MKTKNFPKRLSLSKETVVNLTYEKMQAIQGGLPLTSYNHIYMCYTQCRTGICCVSPNPGDTID